MNASPNIVEHLGHGAATYNARLGNSDVAGLTNAFPYFMYSQACQSGAFDTTDVSIGEEQVVAAHGAFAVVMNSRDGWYASGSAPTYSHEYALQFFDAVFNQGKVHLGEANQASKDANLWRVGSGGTYRWIHFETNLLGDPETSFQLTSNPPPGTPGVQITESSGSTVVTEGGATDSYTVVLTSQPTASVVVTVSPSSSVLVDKPTLTFTAGNWNVAQTVTVTAVNDSVAQGTHTGTISHTVASADAGYNGISVSSVTASITDNDTAGVQISESSGSTAVVEGGATDSYSVVLTSQPTANVVVTVSPNSQVSVDKTTLTFTSSNWNVAQTVTVTAVNDSVAQGTHTGTISHTVASSDAGYNGIGVSSVTVSISDNDTAGVQISESSGSTAVVEGGATDSYSVVLTSQPTANVVVTVSAGSQLLVDKPTLTFTAANWNLAQTVTVTAVNDSVAQGTHSGTISHTVASADGSYSGISVSGVTVTITDNDTPGVQIAESSGSTAVVEGGATDSYSVVLTTQPTANVVVTVAPNSQLLVDKPTLTFTTGNWNLAQTVTVSAPDDHIAQGTHTGTISHTVASSDGSYSGMSVSGVTVSIADPFSRTPGVPDLVLEVIRA